VRDPAANDLESNYQGVFDTKIGFGARPAVLTVDFMRAYTEEGSALYAPAVVLAVARTAGLLVAAREAGVPVIHVRSAYHPSLVDGGVLLRKAPVLRQFVEGAPAGEIDERLGAAKEELVIVKKCASAFFGTSLAPALTALGRDTLIIAGCSTSGCVRATAVDAAQHGFRLIVAAECTGDRHPAPHEASLFDINAKYGDVVGADEVVRYFKGLHQGG
jgi:maleamate amidohydrolase